MYDDLVINDEEYRSKCDQLQTQLASLELSSSPHLVQAGEYLDKLGQLWAEATLKEQRDLTRMMIKDVHVDVLGQRIVSIETLPVFRKLFETFCKDGVITCCLRTSL